jgi:hypothetical protein
MFGRSHAHGREVSTLQSAACDAQFMATLGIMSSLGQAALAAAPIILAVVAGLFGVLEKNVVIPNRTHIWTRIALVLLILVVAFWLIASALVLTGSTCWASTHWWGIRLFAGVQVGLLFASTAILCWSGLQYARLVQRGTQ